MPKGKVVGTTQRVGQKLKREVGLTWRYVFNLGPSLAYRRSKQRPAGEAARVADDMAREGVAVTTVRALFGSDDRLRDLQAAAATLEEVHADELEAARRSVDVGATGEKTYLVRLLGDIATAEPRSPWARLALSPELRGVANAYFGMATQVRDYNVWRNLQTLTQPRESQLWHRDWREDHFVVKAFVYLEDVDEGRGPFTYLPGTHVRGRRRLLPETTVEGHHLRSTDEQIEAVAPRSEWRQVTGPAGTIVLADTTGYHKGGWARTGDRLLYTCLYGSQAGVKRHRLRIGPDLRVEEHDPETVFALDLAR
ncbi:hypothetical protein BH18ACT1_BH18ACT1_10520 [soil metagenome]